MNPTSWTDAHDRLLADTAPPVPESPGAELEQIWAQTARAIEGEGSRVRRRRVGVRVGVAAVIGAAVLGSSGLAAADLITARTGEGPVDAEDLRLGGPGEKLMLAAPDFGDVIAEETVDIPFPSREAREISLRDQVHDERFAGTDEFTTTGNVRAWTAKMALCSWSNQWAAATRDNDQAARAEAIDMIQAAPTWPAVTAIDPEPYSRMETQKVADEEGNVTTEHYRDESLFFYLGPLGQAVEGSDPAAVGRILAKDSGACVAELVPDLTQADPLYPER